MDKRKKSRGAVFIEAAIALPVFFLMIWGTFDILWFSYNMMAIQYVAQDRAGAIATKLAGVDSSDIAQELANWKVKVNPENICVHSAISSFTPGSCNQLNVNDPAQVGKLFSVEVHLPDLKFFGLFSVNLDTFAVGRLEENF